jgi:SAM-dependent methyltransferase
MTISRACKSDGVTVTPVTHPRETGGGTYGIDIGAEFAFDHAAASPATLRLMDAQALEFDDASFDLVYSFHALEHIPNFCEALREMSRVLRLGGTFCIGTPNKARFLRLSRILGAAQDKDRLEPHRSFQTRPRELEQRAGRACRILRR